MIFIDTGFLLALAKPSDALHGRALKWAGLLAGRFLVTEYVLWELLNALSAPLDRAKGHLILSRVKSPNWCEIVSASQELFQAGVQLHRARPDKSWSLTDCISFHIMREREIHCALAFDQHFEQAGFEALLRQDPRTQS
jgi:predicted nucleic acid-binding protein